MAEDKYNRNNPAVKRILQEVKEMQSNPCDDFTSLPLEENIFEWQFAIRGPRDTEFDGGIYHGRIQLPAEYPFKPPSFMLLTVNPPPLLFFSRISLFFPRSRIFLISVSNGDSVLGTTSQPNGRFETQTKICLSISNHHPEHWQPSWSVRTALVALIAFMPTSPNGALGSLDYKKEERRLLAIKSREAAPRFGTPERQKLMDEIHAYMLSKAPSVPQTSPQALEEQSIREEVAREEQESPPQTTDHPETLTVEVANEEVDGIVEESSQMPANENDTAGALPAASVQTRQAKYPGSQLVQNQSPRVQKLGDDRLFTWAAVGLTVAIIFLLLKKFLKSSGHDTFLLNES